MKKKVRADKGRRRLTQINDAFAPLRDPSLVSDTYFHLEDCTPDPAMVEIGCQDVAQALELLDKMKASGIVAQFKGWTANGASFALYLDAAPGLN